MQRSKERFERVLSDAHVHGFDKPRPEDDTTWWIEAQGPVRIDYDAARDEAIVSRPVYVFPSADSPLIDYTLIADFNALHPFEGGYRLRIEEDVWLIVAQTVCVDHIASSGILPFLDDFIARCATCSAWYADRVEAKAPAREVETAGEVGA